MSHSLPKVCDTPIKCLENSCQIRHLVSCGKFSPSRCVMLPTVEPFDTEATACVPVVAKPKCDKVRFGEIGGSW